MDVTPEAGGNYVNAGSVTTTSTDPEAANNQDQVTVAVFIPISIDIKLGSDTNPVNVGKPGAIPVAILTTPTFDASVVDPVGVYGCDQVTTRP